jgi:hypothetical protein
MRGFTRETCAPGTRHGNASKDGRPTRLEFFWILNVLGRTCKKAIVFIPYDAITFASLPFDSPTVEDRNLTAMRRHEACCLKRTERFRDGRSPHPEHDSQQFVSQSQFIGSHSVVGHQKPPATSAFEFMQAIAGHRLRNLYFKSHSVFQSQTLQHVACLDRAAQGTRLDPPCAIRNLHNHAID